MPHASSTAQTMREREQMYLYILEHDLEDSEKKFLTKAIFANQEAYLQSIDLSNIPNLTTKTDVAVNDKDFIVQFSELLRKTQNLKIDQEVLDNMLQSLYKAAHSAQSSSVRNKVTFIMTLLAERKFFINLVRSLLRLLVKQIMAPSEMGINGASSPTGGQPLNNGLGPQFQNDPFLEEEFSKLAQARSQGSPLNAPSQTKKYPISRLLQPSNLNNLRQRDPLTGNSAVDMTTHSAKQQSQLKMAVPNSNKHGHNSTTRTMFNNRYSPNKGVAAANGNSEYRVVSNGGVGLSGRSQQPQRESFSFADGMIKAPVNGVYMAEGNKIGVSDPTSNSPSFGNKSSPRSHHTATRHSRKKSVLGEYNHLFKRIETVQLKHKWETDDEDVGADVTDSSEDVDQIDDDQKDLSESKKESTLLHQKTLSSLSTARHRVQKPEHKNIVVGKRANVRTSDRRPLKISATRQSSSRSPNKQQLLKQQSSSTAGLMFSQTGKGKKSGAVPSQPPMSVQQHQNLRNKVPSRNQKQSSLYTKSVPSLTVEKGDGKQSKDKAMCSQEDDKQKTKLLKEAASLALTMSALSPKSQSQIKTRGIKKTANNPQYASSKFERTYQSLSSQKKMKGSERSDSSGTQQDHNKLIMHHRKNSSPYNRYTDEKYRESMCDPNDLVQQLKQEQEFEYASHQSSLNFRSGGPLMPTEMGAIATTESSQTSHQARTTNSKKVASLLALHKQETSESNEYELNQKQRGKKQMTSQGKLHSRGINSQSKQSQSKLLPTSGQIIEGPTQPKKLDKDAKLLFPQNASQKKSKLLDKTGKANTTARRNSEYSGHKLYQIKTGRDQKNTSDANTNLAAGVGGAITAAGGGHNTRYTSDTASAAAVAHNKHSSPNTKPNHHHQSSHSTQLMHTAKAKMTKQGSLRQLTTAAHEKGRYVSKSGKGTAELGDSDKKSKLSSPDFKHENKIKSAVDRLVEIEKRTAKHSAVSKGSGSWKTYNQSSNQTQPQPASSKNAYGGGIRLNVHHDSSYVNSGSHHQSSQPGAFPKHSYKHSSSQHPYSQSNSCSDADLGGDEDNEEDKDDEYDDADDCDDDAQRNNQQQLERYTQELYSSGQRSDSQQFTDSGRQQVFFQKEEDSSEDEEDGVDGVKQQIVFVDEGQLDTADDNDMKVQLAQNIEEPLESEKSVSKEQDHRTQLHELLYPRPSDSVGQSYQQEEHENLQDFEDEESMFGHLNRSNTNQEEDPSRQETFEGENLFLKDLKEQQEMSDGKVSFNLNNLSHIKSSNGPTNPAHHNVLSNHSSQHNFSVHKHSAASLSEKPKSQNTGSSKLKQHSQLNSLHSRQQSGLDAESAHNHYSRPKQLGGMKQQSQHQLHKSSMNTSNTVRSVSIDLDLQQKSSTQHHHKTTHSQAVASRHTSDKQQVQTSAAVNLGRGRDSKTGGHQKQPQQKIQLVRRDAGSSGSQRMLQVQNHQNDGLRNQSILKSQFSNDIYSEDSVAYPTDNQQYPNDNDQGDDESDQLEDAERNHKLSQVRMELLRQSEIRNSKKSTSNHHLSSSPSDRSTSSAQFKKQLKNIKNSQEQSPSVRQQRQKKDHRRKLFFGVDSSTERDQEDQQDQLYGANNDSNAIEEYSIVNVKQKAQQQQQLVKTTFSPASSVLSQKRASQKNSDTNRHYFEVTKSDSEP